MIKLQVIGNLGKDATVNEVNGKNVINFVVAHTERFRDRSGNNQEKTTWVECSYWSEKAGIAPYLTKGQQVFVEGTPEVRAFEKKDGSTGASLSLRVREIQLLGGGSREANLAKKATNQSQAAAEESIDDLPF